MAQSLEADRATSRRWKSEHRSDYRRYQADRYRRNAEWVGDLKSRPCMDCGGVFPPECMDFDHRDPSQKVRRIGVMMTQSRERLASEIAKCDLVCANCHRIRTKRSLEARREPTT